MDDQASIVVQLSTGPLALSPWDAKLVLVQLQEVYDPDPPPGPQKGRDVLPIRGERKLPNG